MLLRNPELSFWGRETTGESQPYDVILSDPLRQRLRGESEGSPAWELRRWGFFALAAQALAQRVAQNDRSGHRAVGIRVFPDIKNR